MRGRRADVPLTRRQAVCLAARSIITMMVWWSIWAITKSINSVPAAWGRTKSPLNQRRPHKNDMNSSTASHDPYRLPRHVVPSFYDLRIEPDLQSHSFAGHEIVTLTVVEPTESIVMNATELEVS